MEKIKLPKGEFKGNCSTCSYAKFRDRDSQGRVRCEGGYGGYNHPENRNGCFHWKG